MDPEDHGPVLRTRRRIHVEHLPLVCRRGVGDVAFDVLGLHSERRAKATMRPAKHFMGFILIPDKRRWSRRVACGRCRHEHGEHAGLRGGVGRPGCSQRDFIRGAAPVQGKSKGNSSPGDCALPRCRPGSRQCGPENPPFRSSRSCTRNRSPSGPETLCGSVHESPAPWGSPGRP